MWTTLYTVHYLCNYWLNFNKTKAIAITKGKCACSLHVPTRQVNTELWPRHLYGNHHNHFVLHYDSNKVIFGNFFLIFQPFSCAWIANVEFTLSVNKQRTAVDILSVSLNLMINLSGLIPSNILLQQYKYQVHKVPAYNYEVHIYNIKDILVFREKLKKPNILWSLAQKCSHILFTHIHTL